MKCVFTGKAETIMEAMKKEDMKNNRNDRPLISISGENLPSQSKDGKFDQKIYFYPNTMSAINTTNFNCLEAVAYPTAFYDQFH